MSRARHLLSRQQAGRAALALLPLTAIAVTVLVVSPAGRGSDAAPAPTTRAAQVSLAATSTPTPAAAVPTATSRRSFCAAVQDLRRAKLLAQAYPGQRDAQLREAGARARSAGLPKDAPAAAREGFGLWLADFLTRVSPAPSFPADQDAYWALRHDVTAAYVARTCP